MNGFFLKEKLQSFDIQLVELAKKLQISPQTLQSRFKTKDVTISFLIEICNAINKSPYSFLKGSVYEKMFYSERDAPKSNSVLEIASEPNDHFTSQSDLLVDVLQKQVSELKQDKEDLKKDKALLSKLLEEKSGNQKAS